MEQGSIVFLKSGSPKLLIEAVILPKTKEGGVENFVRDSTSLIPNKRFGDFAILWECKGKNERDVLPKESVLEDLAQTEPKTDDTVRIGNVVKSRLSDKLMTVTWIVGVTIPEGSFLNYNEILTMQQRKKVGDLQCRWYEKDVLKTDYFTVESIEKISE
jgi:hypothetical protein